MQRRAMDPRLLALTAAMAALVFVLTLVVHIPTSARGYIHLGDVGVFFASLAFGPWVGAAAGGLGTALSDLASGYPQWAVFSLVIHGLEGFAVGWLSLYWRRLVDSRAAPSAGENPDAHQRLVRLDVVGLVLCGVLGALIVVVGYFPAGVILEGLGAALAEVPANILQAAVGAAVGIPLFAAVRRAYPPITRLGGR